MKFVDPQNDMAFKKIFGDENRTSILISFLIQQNVSPNISYLKKNINAENIEDIKRILKEKTKEYNFKQLAKDIEPFLFNPRDVKKVIQFPQFINSL